MNWKIIILLVSVNVLGTSSKNDPIPDQVNDVEELYDKTFIKLLNSMKTLDMTNITFDDSDVQHLSNDCGADENCLDIKKASIEKYHKKVQGIQCVNVLFVKNFWDTMSQKLTNVFRIGSLDKVAKKNANYMSHMLSVLHMARVTPYRWQIETFKFLTDLKDPKLKINAYWRNLKSDYLIKLLKEYIDKCVLNKYLTKNTDSKKSGISPYVNDIYPTMDNLYQNSAFKYAYSMVEHYTIPNLMLMHFSDRHTIIYDWSKLGIDLNISVAETYATKLAAEYKPPKFVKPEWELQLEDGILYQMAIINSIRLRLLYHIYVHIHIFYTIQSQLPNVGISQTIEKDELLKSWSVLVRPLKNALRVFRIEDNMYWSVMRHMMEDTNGITINKLTISVNILRQQFSNSFEAIGLTSAIETNEKLKTLPVSDVYKENLDSINSNADFLTKYVNQIVETLKPLDSSFVQLLVLADQNTTFYSH